MAEQPPFHHRKQRQHAKRGSPGRYHQNTSPKRITTHDHSFSAYIRSAQRRIIAASLAGLVATVAFLVASWVLLRLTGWLQFPPASWSELSRIGPLLPPQWWTQGDVIVQLLVLVAEAVVVPVLYLVVLIWGVIPYGLRAYRAYVQTHPANEAPVTPFKDLQGVREQATGAQGALQTKGPAHNEQSDSSAWEGKHPSGSAATGAVPLQGPSDGEAARTGRAASDQQQHRLSAVATRRLENRRRRLARRPQVDGVVAPSSSPQERVSAGAKGTGEEDGGRGPLGQAGGRPQARVKISLLGGLSVTFDGRPVSIEIGILQALCAYLATYARTQATARSRDLILEDVMRGFYPDLELEDLGERFNKRMSNLNTKFGRDLKVFIYVREGQVGSKWWISDVCEVVDLPRIEEDWAAIQKAFACKEDRSVVKDLCARLVADYPGDFLPGAYNNVGGTWGYDRFEYYRRKFLRALWFVADTERVVADTEENETERAKLYSSAARAFERYVEHAPDDELAEKALRMAIRTFCLAGEKQPADQVYHAYIQAKRDLEDDQEWTPDPGGRTFRVWHDYTQGDTHEYHHLKEDLPGQDMLSAS